MARTLNHVEMISNEGRPRNVTRRHYESYGDFVEHIEELDENKTEGWGDTSMKATSSDWTLGADYEDSKNLAVDGWTKGRKMMQKKMSDALNSHPMPELRNDWANDNWGFMLDVGSYLAGDELCALRPDESTHEATNVVKLRVSLACASGVSDKMKANWGVGIAFLIDRLEAQGKSVAIEACYYTEGHCGTTEDGETVGKNYLTTITLKNAGEPLDLDRVAYIIAHPAAHRRLIWRTRECEKSLGGDYGGPRRLPQTDEQHLINIEGVQFNQTQSATVESSIDAVTKIYNSQVEALDEVAMAQR